MRWSLSFCCTTTLCKLYEASLKTNTGTNCELQYEEHQRTCTRLCLELRNKRVSRYTQMLSAGTLSTTAALAFTVSRIMNIILLHYKYFSLCLSREKMLTSIIVGVIVRRGMLFIEMLLLHSSLPFYFASCRPWSSKSLSAAAVTSNA